MLIFYYITSHGLGHGTRSIEIITHLSKFAEILIISKSHFIYNSVLKLPKVSTRTCELLDEGVIQENAIEINIEKTWKYHLKFYKNYKPLIEEEVDFIRKRKPDLIICDAPPYPCLAAHQAQIPCILITNFTFDSILETLSGGSQEQKDLVTFFRTAYETCNGLIRLPGYISIPSFTIPISPLPVIPKTLTRFAHQSSLVHRPSKSPPKTILNTLGIPTTSKILLVTFGGFELTFKAINLPPGWVSITATNFNPEKTYFPDLINSVDVVIGKCGYGICSEIYGFKKGLVYVKREGFKEEEGLIELIGGLGVEMGREVFESGEWSEIVLKAYEQSLVYKSNTDGLGESGKGALEIAGFLKGYVDLQNKLN